MPSSRPLILISNDDGVAAPGLLALVAVLRQEDTCDFSVCGPSGERSAQSHSINIHKPLHAFPITVPGAKEAWAVDGTPADSVMLALYGSLLKDQAFDLVVSGINRGDNCGLHVIYSGTVGAAREAACFGAPALALSLDSHSARSVEAFADAARHAATIIKTVLFGGTLPLLRGRVLNVNIPGAPARGYCLTRQGQHCLLPRFEETTARDSDVAETAKALGSSAGLRAFHNRAGNIQEDREPGTDSWAVSRDLISMTPLGLMSDLPADAAMAAQRMDPALTVALQGLAEACAAVDGVCVATLQAEQGITAQPLA